MSFVRNLRQCSTLFATHLHRITLSSKPSYLNSLKQVKVNNYQISLRTISTQRAETNTDYVHDKSDAYLLCNQLSHSLRKFGAIQKENILDLHNAILRSKTDSSSNLLFLLQCCGNSAALESLETRNKLVTDIWNSFLKMDVTLDISHYNILLQVFLENGFDFSPLEFLTSLQERNIHPNRVTFSRLIAKYCETGDVEGANKILEFLKAEELNITENVFNSLIIGYARANDLQGATNILEVMKESNLSPGPDTYAALLQAYIELEHTEGITSLLKQLDADEIFIPEVALLEVAYAIALKGKSEKVNEILSRIKKSAGYVPRSINVICRLLNAGLDEAAYEIFKTVPAHSEMQYNSQYFPRQLALSNIPFTKIVSYCEELRTSCHNISAFENALEGFLLKGDVEKTISFLRVMKEKEVPIREHYIYPLFRSLQNDDTQHVYQALDLISELDLQLSRDFFKIYLLPTLIHSSDIKEISEVYTKLLLHASNYQISVLYQGMIEHLLKEYGLETAAKFVREFRRRIIFPLNILGTAFMESYNVEDTVCILRQMLPFTALRGDKEENEKNDNGSDFGNILKALSYIVNGLKNKNDFESHFPILLENMLHQGVGIDEAAANVLRGNIGNQMTPTIDNLLNELNNPSLIPRLQKSVNTRISDIESQGEDAPQELKYSLIKLYLAKDEIEKALKIINTLKEEGAQIPNNIMVMLARYYLDKEDLAEAKPIFDFLKNEHPDFQISAVTLCKYISTLVTNDKIQEAVQACLMHSPEDGNWPQDLAPDMKDRAYRRRIARILDSVVEKKDLPSLQLLQEALLTKNLAFPAVILSSLIKYHILEENLEKAVETFESIFKEHKVTVSKYELTVACIEKGDTEKLQTILDISNEVHGEMNTLFDLAIAFISAGKIRQAEKVFETPGFRINQTRFDEHCEVFQNIINKPIAELENLVSMSKNIFNVNKQRMYDYLLKAYIARENPDKAVGIWLTMQEEGVTPSETFLYELGNFMKSRNMKVPFTIPKQGYKRPIAKPSLLNRQRNTEQIIERRSENVLDKSRQSPSTVINLLNQNNLEEAFNIAKEMWNSGKTLSKRETESLLAKLSAAGDYQSIEFASKYLSQNIAREVKCGTKLAIAYKNANKTEEYLNQILQHLEVEEDSSAFSNIPYFIMRDIANEEAHLFPLVKKCAEVAVEKGNNLNMANIMNLYLASEKEEEALKIYDSHFKNEKKINIRGICVEEGFFKNNHSVFDSVLKLLNRHPEGRENVIGVVHSIHIDLFRKEEKFEEAVSLIDHCLTKQNLTLENFRTQSLLTLKKTMQSRNLTFPYTITPQSKESSSSSSSDDEKRSEKK